MSWFKKLLDRRKGLDQVADPVPVLVQVAAGRLSGKHNNGHLLGQLISDTIQQVSDLHIWHVCVYQDQVRLLLVKQKQAVAAVYRPVHL